MTPRPLPRLFLYTYLVFSLVWLLVHLVVIIRFRMLDSDSIMYGLPLAFSHGPFDLKIPWIGDFKTYSQVWGHHWPGGMWLRAAIYSVVPFSRVFDLTLLLLAVWGTATLTARLIWQMTGWWWLAGAGALLIMSDRIMMAGIQLHRFEALALLAFMVFLFFAFESREGLSRFCFAAGIVAAFFLPTIHPYGLPLGGLLAGFMILKSFVFKSAPRLHAIAATLAYAGGLLALFLWFYLQPGAWEQFATNIALQKTFNTMGYTSLWTGLSGYRLESGRVLWVFAMLAAFYLVLGFGKNLQTPFSRQTVRWLPAILFLGHAAFHTITKSANYAYLCFGFPLAALVLSLFCKSLAENRQKMPSGLAVAGVLAIILFFAILTPYRFYQFAKVGYPNFAKISSDLLDNLPEKSTVYIPPPLWYAATLDAKHTYKLWTFCIASAYETRRFYEQQAYRNVQPGDFLIVDLVAARSTDPFGILPTFEFRNPDPKFWKLVNTVKQLYPGMDVEFGYNFAIYEYLGGDWGLTL